VALNLLEQEEHNQVGVFHHVKFTGNTETGVKLQNDLRNIVRKFAFEGVTPEDLPRFALVSLVYSLLCFNFCGKPLNAKNLFTSQDEREKAKHRMAQQLLPNRTN